MTADHASAPLPEPNRPIIASDEDLLDFWRSLIQPGLVEAPALWMLLIEPEGHPMRQLMEIAEPPGFPEQPDIRTLAQLLRVIGNVPELPGLRVAPLVIRPGKAEPLTSTDLAWADAYHRAALRAGVPCETVHLATDDGILPLPLETED
ncbi:MAG: hypothetical protein V9F00_01730 [Nocardioides sp.]